jgi:arsenate reductase
MAEGFARRFAPNGRRIYSAGTAPQSVHPLAIEVMKEAGIDISQQRSKGLDSVPLDAIDQIITLCGDAEASCAAIPRHVEHLHWPIPDPASASGDQEAVLQVFRQVRDEIKVRVQSLFS